MIDDLSEGLSGGLSPAQQDVVDLLGASADDRPTFDPALRHRLRAGLEAGLAPHTERVDERLFLNKHLLAQVHGCEARFVAEQQEDFAWTVPTARGAVAHKAIELSVHLRGEQTPMDLVDEAFARLQQTDQSIADWLVTVPDVEGAELRAAATDRVSKFLECWPPLRSRWRPVTESRLSIDLCDDRVRLSGKVDLSLGKADGSTAGKVIVDLKTGAYSPSHTDDLRFYALIETVRLGTPPRKLATHYLDSGEIRPEDVSEAVLDSALARTVDGAAKLVELLHDGRTPTKAPGPPCRWCTLLESCDEGRDHLADNDALA